MDASHPLKGEITLMIEREDSRTPFGTLRIAIFTLAAVAGVGTFTLTKWVAPSRPLLRLISSRAASKSESLTIQHAIDTEALEQTYLRVPNSRANLNELLLPTSADWRYAEPPVVPQIHGGDCFLSSAAHVLSTRQAIATGKSVSLSRQALLDCTAGSTQEVIFAWAATHELPTSEDYGDYNGVKGKCRVSESEILAPPREVVHVAPNARAMMEAVSTGPVGVRMRWTHPFMAHGCDSAKKSTNMYKFEQFVGKTCKGSKAVFAEDCAIKKSGGSVHWMILDGYGHDDVSGEDYWLLKNDWGQEWGEGGWIRVLRKTPEEEDPRGGPCGIFEQATYMGPGPSSQSL